MAAEGDTVPPVSQCSFCGAQGADHREPGACLLAVYACRGKHGRVTRAEALGSAALTHQAFVSLSTAMTNPAGSCHLTHLFLR